MQKIFYVILFFFLIGLGGPRANGFVNFPSGLYSIDDLVEEFRGPLTTKVDELKSTFISKQSANMAEYTSHEVVNCLWQDFEAGASLSRLEYFQNLEVNQLREKVSYFGCGESLSLVETVITEGTDLKKGSFDNILKGIRKFDLNKNETRKVYILKNDKDEELFKLAVRRLPNQGKIAKFFITGSEFLSIRYFQSLNDSRVVFNFSPYRINYKRPPWFGLNASHNFTPFALSSFRKLINGAPQDIYLSSRSTILSKRTFQTYVSYRAIQNGIKYVGSMMKFHLYWFPSTEVISTGGQSQRLLDELRLMLTRLLNNTETNLVKNYVRELINAAENNLLIDKRPNE